MFVLHLVLRSPLHLSNLYVLQCLCFMAFKKIIATIGEKKEVKVA